jgi:hypothetical protein
MSASPRFVPRRKRVTAGQRPQRLWQILRRRHRRAADEHGDDCDVRLAKGFAISMVT